MYVRKLQKTVLFWKENLFELEPICRGIPGRELSENSSMFTKMMTNNFFQITVAKSTKNVEYEYIGAEKGQMLKK